MTIGIGIMIVGIWMAAARIHKDYYYGLATGKVVESSYYENSDDERMYSAIYAYFVGDTEYELEDEEETTKKSSSSKNNSSKNNSSKDNSSKDNSSKKNISTSNTSSWKSYSGDGYSGKLSSDWAKTKGSSVVDIAFTYNGTGLNDDLAEKINVVVHDLKGYDLDLESY